DLSGVTTCRTHQSAHASLRGIAFLAGSHGLLWDDLPQACARTRLQAVFKPRIDCAERARRRAQWQARLCAELDHVRQENTR
ncbi:hypothetical protein ABTD62_21090, partial [Acinetobacter baumannii]